MQKKILYRFLYFISSILDKSSGSDVTHPAAQLNFPVWLTFDVISAFLWPLDGKKEEDHTKNQEVILYFLFYFSYKNFK